MLRTVSNSFINNLLFYQKLTVKKIFSNEELLLYHFFQEITQVFPQNLIIVNEFVFFFLNNENYFYATSKKLSYLRKKFRCRKIVIVREEDVLVNLVYGFFPDPYIHTIKIERNFYSGKAEVIIGFLSYEDRGIAVGCKGNYIKAVNEIFERYVTFIDNEGFRVRIKCDVVKL